MMKETYHFDWNTTDSTVKKQQESSFQKLLEVWREDTDEVFATLPNFWDALIFTYKTLAYYVLSGGFLVFRVLVKTASKIFLLRLISPRTAEIISNWGEKKNEPWSFALFHEDIING